MCDKSRNTWLCVHWQWNTLEWCQLNALQASPVVHLVTPLSYVSLSMNTQPSVPAIDTLRPCQNGPYYFCFNKNVCIWFIVLFWNLFPSVIPLTNNPALLQLWLGTEQATEHYPDQLWIDSLTHIYVYVCVLYICMFNIYSNRLGMVLSIGYFYTSYFRFPCRKGMIGLPIGS